MGINFFSNDLIFVDGEILERIDVKSKNIPAPNFNWTFKVPQHTVGTPNLLIFLNGDLLIKDKHYEDYNSNQIRFLATQYPHGISENNDFSAILVKTESDFDGLSWGTF